LPKPILTVCTAEGHRGGTLVARPGNIVEDTTGSRKRHSFRSIPRLGRDVARALRWSGGSFRRVAQLAVIDSLRRGFLARNRFSERRPEGS
jgi:hypothetical protein